MHPYYLVHVGDDGRILHGHLNAKDLEIIRSAAHELISALDEHLAELRQQREADLSATQEAAFALDNGNTLFIQTCDSGYDYTLYGPDHTALDGGQLDAPGLTLPDAGEEALALLGLVRQPCWNRRTTWNDGSQ